MVKGIKKSLCLLVLLLLSYTYVQGAYFYVKEGMEKCFVESAASNVIITSSYDNFGLKELKCHIIIKNQQGKVVYSHETSEISKGKVSYMAKKNGLYYICISCPSSNWFKSTAIKWSLSIEVGGSDVDIENVAKKSELSETLAILLNLKKKFSSMKLQQIYQKQMATNLYEHNKSVHKKMFYCYILEIIILVAITVYSIVHLKNYFKAQKLM
ncbi:transmembrane emp24 domain-containing protein, putative [Plasmodium knowlesi strain H]|uniref:Transmembrane emp24 domain-containing protein, putative n=3 Tax=Plasmodium knowlesi TaxID=5850 RepID=A0A1A7VIG3_PLAKH|nr:transmembrane emp24 domain-containing protein, putative [Plasmodium knowlesi strain H]OTN66943.1 putative Transmembrane emp24 domain-containing protein [Plasmodium knowlesi]CAA9988564.1 transmembrane emp24 domain-containing protein, putative [Plasmodium knowlesi strain H]SBO21361.1 transmembrane emp24 domain-containing protein, putative [Plasmodium knowlesi strain H]SBO21817.1 transmembrane emp24 domain-containing protein, putative [Plasmodium knowlesi strain H]VVS78038.1 transmembrane emp2